MEKSITELLVGKESGEPVRVGKKIVRTPDSETTITYELAVNPRTGQQEVVENIKTTKKECAICGGYFSQVLTCADCGVRVCANDSRQHTWTTSYLAQPMFRPDKTVYDDHSKIVCKSCARTYGIKD
jgi:iron only hydrogenase large subunit-like protein